MTSERRRVRKVRRGGYLACLLALSLLHRYPTLALPQAPAAAATGHISGHIYRADTGAPLANVTVTAQQNSGSARYWTGKSGADGNYVIEGLPADGLWIGAYREGFVGMFYGNYNGSPAIKLLQPGSAASGVDIRLPVQPKITKIPVDLLATAYPVAINGGNFFRSGRFSPDGSQIALTIGDITIGAPEQVWIHDFRSQKMVRVTEIPQRDLTSQIRSIAWDEDGTLYIKGERCNPCDTFYVAATSERAHVVDRLPDSVAGVFQSEAGPHFVTTENEGHGDIRLRVRTGNETIEIARGNWELESFILDTRRDRLLYPVAEFPPRIAVFDLKTRQNREVFMPGGRRGIADIHLLDQSRDGARVAYSAYGSCLPDESLKDDVYLRISPSPQSTLPRALCLVELHGAQ